MAHVSVTLKLNAAKTLLEATPPLPLVDPGDTIAWKCNEGVIDVSFGVRGRDVFDGPSVFHGNKGEWTVSGKIRKDFKGKKHFDCEVKLDGADMPISYGFETSGSGG